MNTVIGQENAAGTIRIHCPACGARDVPATIIEHREHVTEFAVVTVATHTTWWVQCSNCKATLYSKLNGAQLETKTADELVGLVYYRVSFVHQFLAIAAVALSFTPGLGTLLAAVAWVVNRKTKGWPRKLSKLAFIMSFVFLGGLILMAILSEMGRRH